MSHWKWSHKFFTAWKNLPIVSKGYICIIMFGMVYFISPPGKGGGCRNIKCYKSTKVDGVNCKMIIESSSENGLTTQSKGYQAHEG